MGVTTMIPEEKEKLKEIPVMVVNRADEHLKNLQDLLKESVKVVNYLNNCIGFLQGYLDAKNGFGETKQIKGIDNE